MGFFNRRAVTTAVLAFLSFLAIHIGLFASANAQGVFTVAQLLTQSGATGNTSCLDDPPGSGNFFTHVEFAGSGFIPSNESCVSGASLGAAPNVVGLIGQQVANIRHFLMGSFVETGDLFDTLSGSGLTAAFFTPLNPSVGNEDPRASKPDDLNTTGDDDGDFLPQVTAAPQGTPGNFPEVTIQTPLPPAIVRRFNELERMEKQLAELLAGIEAVQKKAREEDRELSEAENLLLIDLSSKARNLDLAIKAEKVLLEGLRSGDQTANYTTRHVPGSGKPFSALMNSGADRGFSIDIDELWRQGLGHPSAQRFGYAGQPSIGGRPLSRWDIGIRGSAATFDDNQTADRNGDILSLTGHAAYRLTSRVMLGGSLSYKNGRVNSSALNSSLRSNFVGAGLFAKALLGNGFVLDGVAGYEHGFNRLTIAGAAGTFDSNAVNIGAKLSKRFGFSSSWWIEPNAALTYSALRNTSYTDSAGTAVPAATYEKATAQIGSRLGKVLDINANGIAAGEIFTGVDGIFNFVSEADLAVGNAIVASNPSNGFRINGGFDLVFNNGWRSSAAIAYTRLDSLSSFAGSLALKIPLN